MLGRIREMIEIEESLVYRVLSCELVITAQDKCGVIERHINVTYAQGSLMLTLPQLGSKIL